MLFLILGIVLLVIGVILAAIEILTVSGLVNLNLPLRIHWDEGMTGTRLLLLILGIALSIGGAICLVAYFIGW